METNYCSCGEDLVTRDEVTRESCWRCSGISVRLSLLDRELRALAPAPMPAWLVA